MHVMHVTPRSKSLAALLKFSLQIAPSSNMSGVFLEYCSFSTACVRCFMYYCSMERCAHFLPARRRTEETGSSCGTIDDAVCTDGEDVVRECYTPAIHAC